jgi:putative N6-adenine-specific DNA methylase
MNFFAITSPGIEVILQNELKELGIKGLKRIAGGVEGKGKIEDLWKANLWSRTANRIVVRIDEFHASSFHELERRAKKVEWSKYVVRGATVAFRVTCRKSRLYHSDAVAERFENVLVQQLGAKIGDRNTDDDSDGNAQLFIVRIADDVCTVSIDSSGELLHRRGYRQAVAKAPLRETLAAAMLIGSGWDKQSPLVDPMCGSGTIPIEAAMMARNIAPGARRTFAFLGWPDHNTAAWNDLVQQAKSGEAPLSDTKIIASDRDAGAITAAKSNAERIGVDQDIDLSHRALSAVEFPDEKGWIVTNPPYGLRVGESAPLRNLYATLGKVLSHQARGYHLALLSADKKLEAQLRLPLREAFRTTNGGIPVHLVTGQLGRGTS